jgi:hypothetical protein
MTTRRWIVAVAPGLQASEPIRARLTIRSWGGDVMRDGLASAPAKARARAKPTKAVGREPGTHELIERAEEVIAEAWNIVTESRRLVAMSKQLRARREAIRRDRFP